MNPPERHLVRLSTLGVSISCLALLTLVVGCEPDSGGQNRSGEAGKVQNRPEEGANPTLDPAFVEREEKMAFGSLCFGDSPETVRAKTAELNVDQLSPISTMKLGAFEYKFDCRYHENRLCAVEFSALNYREDQASFLKNAIESKYGPSKVTDVSLPGLMTGVLETWDIGKKGIKLSRTTTKDGTMLLLKLFDRDLTAQKEQSDRISAAAEDEAKQRKIKAIGSKF
jgi:hypothetical protein